MKRLCRWIMIAVVAMAMLLVCDRVVPTPSIFLNKDVLEEVRQYLNAHPEYNQNQALIVDFSRLSMLDRMYVVDMGEQKIVYSCRTAHGMGRGSTPVTPEFSNEVGSLCSSLGFYKIAEQGKMRNGRPCLRLDGLSKTNSNARKRGIFIHPSNGVSCVPFSMPLPLPLSRASEGCFATSFSAMERIEEFVRDSNKPMILYAFYK